MTRSSQAVTRPRRTVWIAIGLVLSAGLALQASALLAHRDADRANRAAAVADQRNDEATAALDRADADLTAASSGALAAARALDEVRARLTAAGTSEVTLAGDVVAARAALAALQTQVDAAYATVLAKNTQVSDLRGCLVVGQGAIDAAAARLGDHIDADLAAASAACAGTAATARG